MIEASIEDLVLHLVAHIHQKKEGRDERVSLFLLKQ